MPFYVGNKPETRVVKTLSDIISHLDGVWEVPAELLLEKLGYPLTDKLILVQREGKPAEIRFEVKKFIGYTYKWEENRWWAPLAVQGIDEEGNLVHCFVYIVDDYPSYFANSQSYGPNIWPEALISICQRAISDVLNHEFFRRAQK